MKKLSLAIAALLITCLSLPLLSGKKDDKVPLKCQAAFTELSGSKYFVESEPHWEQASMNIGTLSSCLSSKPIIEHLVSLYPRIVVWNKKSVFTHLRDDETNQLKYEILRTLIQGLRITVDETCIEPCPLFKDILRKRPTKDPMSKKLKAAALLGLYKYRCICGIPEARMSIKMFPKTGKMIYDILSLLEVHHLTHRPPDASPDLDYADVILTPDAEPDTSHGDTHPSTPDITEPDVTVEHIYSDIPSDSIATFPSDSLEDDLPDATSTTPDLTTPPDSEPDPDTSDIKPDIPRPSAHSILGVKTDAGPEPDTSPSPDPSSIPSNPDDLHMDMVPEIKPGPGTTHI